MHVWQCFGGQGHLCKGEELLTGLPEHLSGVCRHVGRVARSSLAQASPTVRG
ncbi:uncharacterized protein PpBr36_06272 [Pyricularia pennisetigena]|uniref:uncharacterized protein n=1 Tax=Pyricularia pennisetigena TaxID=1578925 RepID=UPI001151E561|nr:uncharacterized protein PpBr36_06272 [Pyricularia pennisetigena]TLS23661.1 hypothetical protein PpBr36_06272 [Pyricularia pennisetigena]